jgi:hypothetical protein
MAGATAVLVAAAFVWLGMVLAISFIEAPLKFRAPGITIELGVGIGRLVFRALNLVECVLAAAVLLALALGAAASSAPRWPVGVVLAVIIALDVAWLRPRMDRRVTGGNVSESMPRHTLHLTYVGLELLKVAGLVWLGVLGLAG